LNKGVRFGLPAHVLGRSQCEGPAGGAGPFLLSVL